MLRRRALDMGKIGIVETPNLDVSTGIELVPKKNCLCGVFGTITNATIANTEFSTLLIFFLANYDILITTKRVV